MSREVRRVPLDFDAEIGKTWPGYLMPQELSLPSCPDRDGSGWDATRHWVDAVANLLLMLGDDVREQERGRPMHPYLRWLKEINVYTGRRPAASATAFADGLAGRPADPLFGHGCGHGTAAIIKAAGLDPETWAVCATCSGKGHVGTPEQVAAQEAWEPTEHPHGDGWQLWQTVSEGGPVSPVFATADDLATWMSDPARGDQWVPGSVAAKFIEEGWAPSGASSPATGFMTGVEWIGHSPEPEVSR